MAVERVRIAAALIVFAILLVTGVATTMLFAARSEQEKVVDPQMLFQEAKGEKGSAIVADKISLSITAEADILDLKTGPAFGTSSKPTPKPSPVIALSPGKSLPAAASSRDTSRVRAADSDKRASTQGAVYTWYDGDRVMRAVLQNDLVAQETSDNADDDEVVVSRVQPNVVRKRSSHSSDSQPVFKPESGDGLMTLPGGVLLALDQDWDDFQVQKFFAGNDISQDRVSELDFMDNGFLVATDPGFPALDLANELAHQEGVASSSPNWSRERNPR